MGKPVERGLFEASGGTHYNAGVNGAANTARKVTSKLDSDLFESEEGLKRAVDPRRLRLSDAGAFDGSSCFKKRARQRERAKRGSSLLVVCVF